jgi:hypothetical protein
MGVLCWIVAASCVVGLLMLSLAAMERCASGTVASCCGLCAWIVALNIYTVFTIIVRTPDTIAWLLHAC